MFITQHTWDCMTGYNDGTWQGVQYMPRTSHYMRKIVVFPYNLGNGSDCIALY